MEMAVRVVRLNSLVCAGILAVLVCAAILNSGTASAEPGTYNLTVNNGGHGITSGSGSCEAGTYAAFSIDTTIATEVAWSYATGNMVFTSPAVVEGKVYVGSWDYNVYALDAATGALVWKYTTGNAVSSSPAVADGKVYIGSNDHNVYALNAATGALVWSYATGDQVASSPAVSGGKVYVGSNDHNVYALDAATGALVWKYTTGSIVRTSPAVSGGKVYIGSMDHNVYALDAATGARFWTYVTGDEVASSPAVADGKVYIGSGDHNVYALDAATGALVWKHATGYYVASSPAVADGKVYVGSDDGYVYAFDAATGTLVWAYAVGGYVWSTPAVADGKVYVDENGGYVYALNAATGALVWKYAPATGYDIFASSPAVAGGKVYIGSGDHNVYALWCARYVFTGWSGDSASTSQSDTVFMDGDKTVTANWEFLQYHLTVNNGGHGVTSGSGSYEAGTHAAFSIDSTIATEAAWTYATGDWVSSSPAVANGVVYIGSRDHDLYALDAVTGAPVWSYATGGQVDSSPAVADGKVYIGMMDHSVYALDAVSGAFVWSHATGGIVYSSPAVADGKVYVGSDDGKVYALNAATGAFVWSYVTGDMVRTSPVVAGDRVYIGSFDHSVYALDAATGTVAWRYTTGGEVFSSPAVADGNVYVGSYDGKVYALNAATGAFVWSYATGSSVLSSPVVADGKVYMGSWDHNVYALNAVTGALVWSYATGGEVLSSPAVADGNVYVGSYDGKVYALNAVTGALVWSYATGGEVISSPAAANGIVYIGSADGKVYALWCARYVFTGWSGDSTSTNPSDTILMDGDKTVTANWETTKYEVTFDQAGIPSGVGSHVTVGTVEHLLPYSEWFDLRATVDFAYENPVAGATGTQYVLMSTSHTTGFTISGTTTVTATYKTQYYLTVNNGGYGTASGTDWYDKGASATFAVDSTRVGDVYAAWSYTTGGKVRSSPVVVDGMIYFSSQDGKVYAFNLDGSYSWSYQTGSFVYSSPAVANGIVYVGSSDFKIYALNAVDGTLVWSFTTGGQVYSSPVVADGRVYIGSSDYRVYALDAAHGTLVWSYATSGGVFSSPAVANGKLYVGSEDHSVYALNLDGTLAWSYLTGGLVRSSPTVADNRIYIGSFDNKVYALNLDGTLAWSFATNSLVQSSPAVADGRIYVGSYDGKVYALNLDGTLAWSYTTGGQVWSSPAVVDGMVYVGSWDSRVYALNLDGTLAWSYGTSGPVQSSPAVADGRVYIGSEDFKLYALTCDARYVFTGWSGDSSSTNRMDTILMDEPKTVTAVWTTEYLVTFDHTGLSGDAYGIVVTVNDVPVTCPDLPYSIWVDPGSTVTYSYSSPVSGGMGKQYVLIGVAQSGSTSLVAGPVTVTGTYKTQYWITFAQSGVGTDFAGTVMTVGSTDYGRAGHADWYDSGASISFSYVSPLEVTANEKRYVLTGVDATSSLTVSGAQTVTGNYKTQFYVQVTSAHDSPTSSAYVDQGSSFTASVTSPTETVTDDNQWVCTGYKLDGGSVTAGTSCPLTNVQAAHTIVFQWTQQFWVSFAQSGVRTDFAGTVMTVGSTDYGRAGHAAWYDSGARIGFSFASPLVVKANEGRYVLTGVDAGTPLSVTMAQTVTGTYKTQYYLTVLSDHDTPGGYGWYDLGSTAYATIQSGTVVGTGVQYVFSGWSVNGVLDGTGMSTPVIMNGPMTAVANWVTVLPQAPPGTSPGSPASRAGSYQYTAPSDGTWRMKLVNDGVTHALVTVVDISVSPNTQILNQDIKFSSGGAFPKGTLYTNYVSMVAGHIYQVTITPYGAKGSIQVFDEFTPKGASLTQGVVSVSLGIIQLLSVVCLGYYILPQIGNLAKRPIPVPKTGKRRTERRLRLPCEILELK
jgi:uncharacterized repeat protein (TIGR02543 family)